MSFMATSDSYSILEDIYYKYLPVSDTLRFIAISDMFADDLQSGLSSVVAEFDKVYNKKLTTKHDVLEYVLAFAAHNKLPLRLHGQNQTCAAIKKLLLIKRSLNELIEMGDLDTPPVTISEIKEYQKIHPESVLNVCYGSSRAGCGYRFFLLSDSFFDFRQWRTIQQKKKSVVRPDMESNKIKNYVIDNKVAEYLRCKIFFSDFKAYKALFPDRILFVAQSGYHKNRGIRAYLKRSAIDDFAAWHKVRNQQRKDNANKGTEKLKIASKLLKIENLDKTYRILSETKRKTNQELEEIYLQEQQAEINRRMAHNQEIKRLLATGEILSIDDLVKCFSQISNVAELFAEYATESEFVIDKSYLLSNKVSDFAFYMGLDISCKTPENKDISSFNSRDVFSLSDSQMDRIATRLASGASYRSERNAIVVLLEQIRQEIKR